MPNDYVFDLEKNSDTDMSEYCSIEFLLTPSHATFLAERLSDAAERCIKKGNEKFRFVSLCSLISCTQR